MERLTKRSNDTTHVNGVCCTHFMSEECQKYGGHCSDGCRHEEDVWEKLARYEDLEEQGLLLRLPCKVGAVVYCTRTTLDENGKLKREIVEEIFKLEMLIDLGYAVFLTREEAEQTLAKMKEV